MPVADNTRRGPRCTAGAWTRLGLLLLLTCVGGGCRTHAQRFSSDLTTIVIRGRSEEEIRQAALAVFTRKHYEPSTSAPREMVFEKKAGAMSNVLYGGWPGADERLWERVKLTFLPQGDAYVVGLNAFLVSDKGQDFFEQEKKRSKVHRRSYGKLLRAIQDQLK